MRESTLLRRSTNLVLVFLIVGVVLITLDTAPAGPLSAQVISTEIDTTSPEETAKLVFVHASIGEAWLALWVGQLGSIADGGVPTFYAETSLKDNNYFVSDYNAPHVHPDEWPEHDYCDWPDLFGNPAWMNRMLNYSVSDSNYERLADPGGENDIIMIKPCGTQYPIGGNPNDPPSAAGSACEGNGTVGDIKRAMLDLLEILRQRPDKFFVLVTAPPAREGMMINGENARAIANWMVHDMLDGYDVGNVMVFDLYNVLTSNHQGEGDPCQQDEDEQSDVGLETGNHHRIWNGQIQHQVEYDQNYTAYCDGHQKKGGTRKATTEFVPLLNAYYNAWLAGGYEQAPLAAEAPTLAPTETPMNTPTMTAVPTTTPTQIPSTTATVAVTSERTPTHTLESSRTRAPTETPEPTAVSTVGTPPAIARVPSATAAVDVNQPEGGVDAADGKLVQLAIGAGVVLAVVAIGAAATRRHK